jgi:polyisoprenoid-binding protein YceI
MNIRSIVTAASTTSLLLAGCARDPAKDAPKATVAPAVTTAEAPAVTPAPPSRNAAGAEVLPIDTTMSKLNWTGSKVTKVHPGGFKTFAGTITLVDGAVEKSKVDLDIDVDSLWADSDRLVGHLKSPDFFDSATFPKATFTTTAITAGGADGATHTVKGSLTLHGVTKEISFPATITVAEKQVTAKARFSLNRQDFGIAYKGAADDLVRDDVLVEWEVTAKRA